MMRFARFARPLAVLALAALCCTAAGAQTAAPAPVDIYAILPLTGNLAFLGSASQKALQGLEARTNAAGGIRGRPLKFIFEDDQTNPVVAVQLANQLPKATPVFMDGGPLGTCKATSAATAAGGPVDFCLSPGLHPVRGTYAFSSSISLNDCFDATFRYMAAKGWNRIALLNVTDASGQEGQAIFEAMARKYKMTIVDVERFGNADISIAAQISKLLAADPQAIVLGANGLAAGTALRGLSDAGSTLPVATTSGNMINAALATYRSVLPKTYIVAAPRWSSPESIGNGPVKDAVAAYLATIKEVGLQPDMGSSLAYDPGLLIVGALRKLGPDATASQVRDYFLGLYGFAGSNGFYDFRANSERGLTVKDVVVVQYDGARQAWFGVSGPGGAAKETH